MKRFARLPYTVFLTNANTNKSFSLEVAVLAKGCEHDGEDGKQDEGCGCGPGPRMVREHDGGKGTQDAPLAAVSEEPDRESEAGEVKGTDAQKVAHETHGLRRVGGR